MQWKSPGQEDPFDAPLMGSQEGGQVDPLILGLQDNANEETFKRQVGWSYWKFT